MSHVLLIEDNPLNAELIADMFNYDDVPGQLVRVGSGEEALRIASRLDLMLVLVDIHLPGIDGIEVTRLLKSDPATRNVPVWAITAFGARGDMDRALAAGCTGFFVKPVSTRQLADQLRALAECRAVGVQ
jgi:two-component system cell cycle response regulator DivK